MTAAPQPGQAGGAETPRGGQQPPKPECQSGCDGQPPKPPPGQTPGSSAGTGGTNNGPGGPGGQAGTEDSSWFGSYMSSLRPSPQQAGGSARDSQDPNAIRGPPAKKAEPLTAMPTEANKPRGGLNRPGDEDGKNELLDNARAGLSKTFELPQDSGGRTPWGQAVNRQLDENARQHGQPIQGPLAVPNHVAKGVAGGAADSAYNGIDVMQNPAAATAASKNRWDAAANGDYSKVLSDYWNNPGRSLAEDASRANTPFGTPVVASVVGDAAGGLAHLGADVTKRWGPAVVPGGSFVFKDPYANVKNDYKRDPWGTLGQDLGAAAIVGSGFVGGGGAGAAAGSASRSAAGGAARSTAAGTARSTAETSAETAGAQAGAKAGANTPRAGEPAKAAPAPAAGAPTPAGEHAIPRPETGKTPQPPAGPTGPQPPAQPTGKPDHAPSGPAGRADDNPGGPLPNRTFEVNSRGEVQEVRRKGPNDQPAGTEAAPRPASNLPNDLEEVFGGQPRELQRYQELSRKPSDQLSPEEFKFVHSAREQLRIQPGETMTKVLGKDAVDNMINGTYRPDQVRGFVARARDADSLRTPQELRDGLGLDDSPSAALGQPWSPIPENAPYAYQLRWRAENGDENMSIPYGAPKGTAAGHVESQVPGSLVRNDPPFTGTGTTSGGIPEWTAATAPIGRSAQIWRIDRSGNREPYAQYDPNTNAWSPVR